MLSEGGVWQTDVNAWREQLYPVAPDGPAMLEPCQVHDETDVGTQLVPGIRVRVRFAAAVNRGIQNLHCAVASTTTPARTSR